MKRARIIFTSLAIWMGALTTVTAQESPTPSSPPPRDLSTSSRTKYSKLPLPIELEKLPPQARDAVVKVMKAPSITAVSPLDGFASSARMYLWLLDHPDRVSLAWQRLSIAAIGITELKDGRFLWKDDQGNELVWETIVRNGDGRIWYAEGKVRPARLMPVVSVKAVAVLRHGMTKDENGDPLIRHQVELFMQTDSKTAALVMRLAGPAAPRMAEDGADQLLLFFSGIARYLDRHPEKTKTLLDDK